MATRDNAWARTTRRLAALMLLSVVASACSGGGVLRELVDARRESSALRVAFLQESEASTRAVLAEDDETAAAAARDARDAAARVSALNTALASRVQSLGYGAETGMLAQFTAQYREYTDLEHEALRLAVENSNAKAQRLAAGAGQRAADAFVAALGRVPGLGSDGLAARAALLELQLIETRHIMEADDAEMTALETRMDTLASVARAPLSARPGAPVVAEAVKGLDAFLAVHAEVMALSRRNTDIKGLALTLGRKRVVAASCEDALAALDAALSGHGFQATR